MTLLDCIMFMAAGVPMQSRPQGSAVFAANSEYSGTHCTKVNESQLNPTV